MGRHWVRTIGRALALVIFTGAFGCSNPAPYQQPDVLNVQDLPNGGLNLQGAIIIAPAEQNEGDWATGIVQTNTSKTPAHDELARRAQPLDLLFGEALDDATWFVPSLSTRVRNPSVVFQIPVSYTNTGLQPTGPDYSCDTGETCVPDYIADGTGGLYRARIEDCLSGTDPHPYSSVKDHNGDDLTCTGADGIQDKPGKWYDIGKPWEASEYLQCSCRVDTPGPTVTGTLSVPATLPVPVNSIRIEIALGLVDGPGFGDPNLYLNDLYWGSGLGPYNGPEYALTRIALQFPPITVLPAAFVQLKVLPYTIVYRPPGDQSSGTYTATESFKTSMFIGSNNSVTNTKAFESSYGVSDGDKVMAFLGSVGQVDGQSLSSLSAWDTNSTIGTGLTVTNSHTIVRSFKVGSNSPSVDPSIIPAREYVLPNTCGPTNYPANCSVNPRETYRQEPFWGDRFVLLLNPQLALWDFNAGPATQLLGAADFVEVSVTDLDACARNSDPNANAWQLTRTEWLTPVECRSLLSLDPFYGFGQGLDPSAGRGLDLGGTNYGRDARNPSSALSPTFDEAFSYEVARATSGSATYKSTVTDVIGFSWSDGLSLSYKYSVYGLNVGFSNDVTVTRGEKTTSGTAMQVTYTASSVATDTEATKIEGAFGDDHDFYTPDCQQDSGKCYSPKVEVYLDELFGSYMFRDPDAGCYILSLGCRSSVVVPGGGVLR